MKEFYIIAVFGKKRNPKLKQWFFSTRKAAKLFAKIFLDHNPFCRRYSVVES